MKLAPHSYAQDIGRRKTQEDRSIVVTTPQGTLFGVFDGHSGPHCVQFVTDNFAKIWIMALKAAEDTTTFPFDPKAVLQETFKQIAQRTSQQYNDGCTASIVWISPDYTMAHVAVLGDSPVIIRQANGLIWESPSHNVRSNYAEAIRAEARGGVIYRGYLLDANSTGGHGLQMSRVFGDADLHSVLDRNPEVFTILLAAGSWVFVGTDGTLDPTHSDGVAAAKVIELLEAGADAQAVVDHAVKIIKTEDNATALVVRVCET